ncbi:MAG TPA: uroporphyrinogen-III C-methyltransferase [Thermomicrobiales bacterium]|nr:uroporphyrinogen-III C-methyltransferase [Thermomicrobiales bacterium]
MAAQPPLAAVSTAGAPADAPAVPSSLVTRHSSLVSLVGAGPGDAGLLTVRGLERLRAAEVVVYDRLLDPRLLDEAPADAERIYVGKEPGRHALRQDEINALLVARGLAGRRVVRLKGGDPFVFGRGGEEAEALAAAGVHFEVVPGVTSAVAAPAYAGIPVTHRDATSAVTIVTGHEDPAREGSRLDWDALARSGTLVFLMGVGNLPAIAARLVERGRPADTPAAAIEWGTWARQRVVTGTLAGLHDAVTAAGLGSPATIVVGEVARLRERLRWFDDPARRPLLGKRVLVTRARAQASELSRALADLGAIPAELPAIRFADPEDYAPVDAAIADLAAYGWVIFTSANSVARFFARLCGAGKDARALAGARLVAIGSGTARALADQGLVADIVPERFVAEAVVERLTREDLAGARVLLPRAAEARDVLPRELARLGATVDVVPVYRTVQAPPDPALLAALAAGEIDIVTFTSSSTVTNLVALIEETADGRRRTAEGRDPLGGALVACIGPVTAQTARERGLRVDVVAAEHSIPGLVAALVERAMSDE